MKVKLTFGLNALVGKKNSKEDKLNWKGNWNPINALSLMMYTVSKGYNVDSYELGNELCSEGVSARVDSVQYAKDMTTLRLIVNRLYPDASTRPKVLGPAGFYGKEWFDSFLQHTGPGVLDGVTHHIYNLGAGVDKNLINKVQDPFYLSQFAQTFKDVSEAVKDFTPWAGPWVGESGGAYNSGGKDVSDTFVNGFWYLDQLGMASTFNHKVYCRQALIGGNYALLNTTTFIPNPDYYGALLWHRLMGKSVLSISHEGSPYLRTYAHCSKKGPGITVLLINMSNSTSFDVSLVEDMNLYPKAEEIVEDMNLYPGTEEKSESQSREEYHLTPKDGNIQSQVVLLNGTPLRLTKSLDIPELKPELVDPSSKIKVVPDSIVFVTLKSFNAPACAYNTNKSRGICHIVIALLILTKPLVEYKSIFMHPRPSLQYVQRGSTSKPGQRNELPLGICIVRTEPSNLVPKVATPKPNSKLIPHCHCSQISIALRKHSHTAAAAIPFSSYTVTTSKKNSQVSSLCTPYSPLHFFIICTPISCIFNNTKTLGTMSGANANKRKRQDTTLASVSDSLSNEERIVYDIIRSKQDMGIWTGDIKRETTIPDNILKKAIKLLQDKQLIKQVKSIQNKARTLFMATEFQPSKEITGGHWYTEGKLDVEFIDTLKELCLGYLSRQKVATVDMVVEFAKKTGAFKVEITDQNLEEVLNILVLENVVSQVKSTGFGEFAAVPVGRVCYGYKGKVGGAKEGSKVGAMASTPCGVCPRINFCTPDGVVNPMKCYYFDKWFVMPGIGMNLRNLSLQAQIVAAIVYVVTLSDMRHNLTLQTNFSGIKAYRNWIAQKSLDAMIGLQVETEASGGISSSLGLGDAFGYNSN
ncbi:hypothetical protein RIF29_16674 [Crotalaria pallida]|uniref:Uncharacterized protein n=1 Tax=Crotalaria pallida TaxID=3830 RepID=A0AAN9FGY8_CROPI